MTLKTITLLSLISAALSAVAACAWLPTSGEASPQPCTITGDLETVATNPDIQEEIIRYKGMTVSFNRNLHIPNWVAWELTADETSGTTGRSSKFNHDADVAGCAWPSDYTGSGYDRGHMAPAGDMKWDPEAMAQTFLMTNIAPQAHSLNSGSWKSLEEKCRKWATIDSAIVIVCGPVLRNPIIEYIGDTQVAVPAEYFKVILAPYSDPPRGIGFIMPNGKVPGGMQQCSMTIDQVEEITGHDFFPALPDSIENIIEAQNQFHLWSTLR